MQTYIISNKNDEYWTGKKLIENETIIEENPNFQFVGFNSPEEANFFNPMFENLSDLKIWKCESKELVSQNWLHSINKSILPLSVYQIEELTDIQYITIAILGVISIVKNNKIRSYCYSYLKNQNRKPETAEKLYNKLSELNNNTRPEEEYIGPALPLLKGIKDNNLKPYCVKSLYRSICDSNIINNPLNFQIIYQAVKNLSLEDITERLKNNTNLV